MSVPERSKTEMETNLGGKLFSFGHVECEISMRQRYSMRHMLFISVTRYWHHERSEGQENRVAG